MRDIVVLSHLRWNSVIQRPHHIITLLSKKYRILFVEEPVDPRFSKKTYHYQNISSNISVLTPYIPWNSWSVMGEAYVPLLQQYLAIMDIKEYIFWTYSPNYMSLISYFDPKILLYDCMADLTQLINTSSAIQEYEKQLINTADIIFTSGKSLFEKMKKAHSQVYYFPNSVDSIHFSSSRYSRSMLPIDLKTIPSLRVGYIGVIDERLNFELIDKITETLPQVSFVFIGPIGKVNPQHLPHRSNIYYLGKKTYKELPSYLRDLSVIMMPFAINKTSTCVGPTKTMEYIAALKPVVSTPIKDVVRDYNNLVAVGNTVNQWKQAITIYLQETAKEKSLRENRQKAFIKQFTWEKTVSGMQKIVDRFFWTKYLDEEQEDLGNKHYHLFQNIVPRAEKW